MSPPPQGRPWPAALSASAGLLPLVLIALIAGCGGGDNVEPRPRGTITRKAGSPQEAIAGSAVAIAPSVAVTDADANPVAGVPVTFQVTSGAGSVSPATPINTDAQGTATVTSWTLGTAPGPNTLSASAADVTGSPVVFTATGLAGATIRGTITVSNDLAAANGTTMGTRTRLAAPPLRRSRAFRQPEYTPDELIVRFRPAPVGAPSRGASALALRSSAVRVGSEIRARMAPLLLAHAATLAGVSPALSAARVRVESSADIARVTAALRRDPAVATVERTRIIWSARASGAATGHSLGRLSGPSNDPVGILHAWSHGIMDVPEAWSMTMGSASVLVAVISDGIRFDHPDIAANLTPDGYDFVSNPAGSELPLCAGGSVDFSGDGDGYDPDPTTPTSYLFDFAAGCGQGPEEVASFGLADAGIIGAVGNNAIGVSGINWAVRIRPIRMIGAVGFATPYDLAQAILYAAGLPADNGAGGVIPPPTVAKIISIGVAFDRDEAIVREAVIAASNAGALVIAGAGFNATADAMYPAAYPEVVAASGVGPDREVTAWSSFGPSVDIAAPGGDFDDGDFSFGVGSTFWDFAAEEPIYALGAGPGITAAHVAGVAALLLAQDPGLTSSELRSRLIDYAVDAGAPGRDDIYGAGIVNARNSLARNLEPPRQLHARLYDALTGSVVQTVAVAGDGSYSFTTAPGSYQVFAGQDAASDGLVGLPGRRWGAFGGSVRPTRVDVNIGASHHASFTIGFPSELEPNETVSDANALPVGGYLSGVVSAARGGDTDVFRVLIAQAGEYTFETSGVDGACGFALEENTIMGLYGQDESKIALSDDIDTAARSFCSRITTTLQPGTYYLWVQGFQGPTDVLGRGGRYQVQARSGP